MNYRELGTDEVIEPGDSYDICDEEEWEDEVNWIGKTVAMARGAFPSLRLRYRRPIADSCPPTPRNTGTCERCRRMEEQLSDADGLLIAARIFMTKVHALVVAQSPEAHELYLAMNKFAADRARPEIEVNNG